MMPESGSVLVNQTASNTRSGDAVFSESVSPGKSPANSSICASPDLAQMVAKIDSLKKWTVSTYKTTKQSICENLGKVDRTVDKELEDQIDELKGLHKTYAQVLSMATLFTNHFRQMNEAQKGLADSLYQLSLKENTLRNECNSNCDSLRSMNHNGELLEKALTFFLSSLKTLCEKTIDDTLLTVHNHDQARLEFDVYRHEVLALQQHSAANSEVFAASEYRCNQSKERYEQLKKDVKAKLKLLQENRIKVMRKQLLLLRNALAAYFSGNVHALQSAMSQFGSTESKANDLVAPSFLEQ